MVPVDHVARIITACAFHGRLAEVVHITSYPGSTFEQLFSALIKFGFDINMADYSTWSDALRRDFAQSSINALYPLQHFVLHDLQHRLQAPILDDRNASSVLLADNAWTQEDFRVGRSVTTEDIGKYLAFLVGAGFLNSPTRLAALTLPSVPLMLVTLRSKHMGGRAGHV
jgi:L-2-aminoadipate reductase